MKFREYTAAIYRTAAHKARRQLQTATLSELSELGNLELAMAEFERDHAKRAEKVIAGFVKA